MRIYEYKFNNIGFIQLSYSFFDCAKLNLESASISAYYKTLV